MARRRKNPRRGDDSGSWVPVAALAILLIALAVGIAYLYYDATSRHVAIDQQTLCPLTGPEGRTLVLIDTTDTIAGITQSQVIAKLRDAALATPKGNLFEIRILNATAPVTRVLFALCNPGDGSDLNEITGNPELALRRWREGFEQPLNEVMTASLNAAPGESSPIMAGIQTLAVANLTAKMDRERPASLIVISDMLENTERFSHYRQGTDFEAFLASTAAAHFATDLADKVVTLWMIRRDTRVDGVRLAEFWQRWITYNHGRFGSVVALQGI